MVTWSLTLAKRKERAKKKSDTVLNCLQRLTTALQKLTTVLQKLTTVLQTLTTILQTPATVYAEK